MISINLWNPTDVSLISALVISYLLGIIHGITPDEHTWPITFSYAVGSYSRKGGAKAGLIFSSGFTLQRAIMSEIAFLALAGFLITDYTEGIVYLIVGTVMALSGLYITKKLKYPHFHFIEEKLGYIFRIHGKGSVQQKREFEHAVNPIESNDSSEHFRPIPMRLAFVHGIIAGFGFGAFALIIYTVLAPSMPNIFIGFLPGMLFGLGTLTMQVIIGAGFGTWLTKIKKLKASGISFVSRGISSSVLTYGGMVFVVTGFIALVFPQVMTLGITTPLHIHNLHDLGMGFFLVIISVVVIGVLGYRASIRKAIKLGYAEE